MLMTTPLTSAFANVNFGLILYVSNILQAIGDATLDLLGDSVTKMTKTI